MKDDFDPVTQQELSDLEYRLFEKFDEVENVREQNSRLALDAAWGIVPHVNSLSAWVLAAIVMTNVEMPWWGTSILVLGILFANGYFYMKANEERMKEVERLSRITPYEMRNK